jgi:hypothetical protein
MSLNGSPELIEALSYVKFTSPLTYTKYLNNKLGEYGGFNLACGTKPFKCNNTYYNVFCLRYIYNISLLNELIPGNSKCDIGTIPKKDEGYNFIWNNWNSEKLDNYVFIGEIESVYGTIKEIQRINDLSLVSLEDLRLYHIYSTENIHTYILCPRTYIDANYTFISIKTTTENYVTTFKTLTLKIDYPNLSNCGIGKSDWNLPIYECNITTIDR